MDFGEGVKTDAQLTYPAIGNGSFPGILLITGSGAEDMNETAGFIRVDNNTGENYIHLLQQKLTQLKHPDHALITYLNLGHEFHPSSQWFTQQGSIPEYVLADLYAWLEPRSGFTDLN
jgi:hypothetical protein